MLDPQAKGVLTLTVMTVFNCAMAIWMLNGLETITGLAIAFVGMGIICLIGQLWLIGKERPWRRPTHKNRGVSDG